MRNSKQASLSIFYNERKIKNKKKITITEQETSSLVDMLFRVAQIVYMNDFSSLPSTTAVRLCEMNSLEGDTKKNGTTIIFGSTKLKTNTHSQ